LTHGEKTIRELTDLFPGRSKSRISQKRYALGLRISKERSREIKRKNIRKVIEGNRKVDTSLQLSDLKREERQVLLGCLFGDGGVERGKNCLEYRFRCQHSFSPSLYSTAGPLVL